jgi:excisionase family DNA binding protein
MRQAESRQVDAKLLRVGEVAKVLSVSRSHVYRLIESGEIPATRLGRTVRVRREWLEEFTRNADR